MHKFKSHFILATGLLLLCCYERGYRIADLSDTPHSHRPASIIVAGRE